ncbi:MAG: isoprenylcysteine carboxylmethyltransferase family protein [Nitrospirae bacterium]|nr:isoprenylcysteine carboxylmethyltransferase family protein [Nitrospirota bacterium]
MQKFNQLVGHYRTFISLIIGVVFLWVARPDLNSLILGVPFILLGELIRTWAAGCINKEYEQLTTVGPYAYTRNPLYVGNFLLGLGFVIIGKQWIAAVLFLFLFFVIYRSTILDEEKTLLRVFGQTFNDYQKNVPRFIPRWPLQKIQPHPFYWERVFRHREYNAWMGIIGVLAVFIIKIKVVQ